MTRAYVAGPMTGLPGFNFPAFAEAAAELRSQGYAVTSPHELDLAEGFDPADPEGFDLRAALERDIAAVAACDVVVLLPGWEASPGVAVELTVAEALGKSVREYATLAA